MKNHGTRGMNRYLIVRIKEIYEKTREIVKEEDEEASFFIKKKKR